MKYSIFTFLIGLAFGLSTFSQDRISDTFDTGAGELIISPVLHGTLAMQWNHKTIYNDPYGGKAAFAGLPVPDLILITDIHGDHLNEETLKELDLEKATIIAPQAVIDQMDDLFKEKTQALPNGEKLVWNEITVEAVPMYNLPETSDSRHTKGRGNGYVLTFGSKRIYISGDTEDIPEMRALRNIDIAFVCMNMPYTMDVGQAADAVLEFKPKVVYPYHYRGSGGLNDVEKFKSLVNNSNKDIDVRLRNWYPEN